MSTAYKFSNPTGIHFISIARVEWVDVFTRKEYVEIVLESLKHCQKEKGLIIYAWCIMSNHVHLIISAMEGFVLSGIVRDFKCNRKITMHQFRKVGMHQFRQQ
jgi:REP element-mobilizing transposase RayT